MTHSHILLIQDSSSFTSYCIFLSSMNVRHSFSSYSSSPLLTLPNEVWVLILKKLHLSDIARISRCSKYFRNLVDSSKSIWEAIWFRRYGFLLPHAYYHQPQSSYKQLLRNTLALNSLEPKTFYTNFQFQNEDYEDPLVLEIIDRFQNSLIIYGLLKNKKKNSFDGSSFISKIIIDSQQSSSILQIQWVQCFSFQANSAFILDDSLQRFYVTDPLLSSSLQLIAYDLITGSFVQSFTLPDNIKLDSSWNQSFLAKPRILLPTNKTAMVIAQDTNDNLTLCNIQDKDSLTLKASNDDDYKLTFMNLIRTKNEYGKTVFVGFWRERSTPNNKNMGIPKKHLTIKTFDRKYLKLQDQNISYTGNIIDMIATPDFKKLFCRINDEVSKPVILTYDIESMTSKLFACQDKIPWDLKADIELLLDFNRVLYRPEILGYGPSSHHPRRIQLASISEGEVVTSLKFVRVRGDFFSWAALDTSQEYLVTASYNQGTILMWNLPTGTCRVTLQTKMTLSDSYLLGADIVSIADPRIVKDKNQIIVWSFQNQ